MIGLVSSKMFVGLSGIVAEKNRTTNKKVGEIYSLSKNTVSRYIRIQFLIPVLKNLLDDEILALRAAVTISFLKEDEQALLADCIERNNLTVDMKKADALRQLSEKEKLNGESVYRVLSGAMLAVCNTPDIEKVIIETGSMGEIELVMHIAIENTEVINPFSS